MTHRFKSCLLILPLLAGPPCTAISRAAELSFTDITREAGTGGPTERGQTGGHGVMFADVDGDALPDLYITMIFDDPMPELFYRNLGGGRFQEKAARRGIDDFDGGSHGACFADLNNNGHYDLFNGATWHSPQHPAINRIYRNDGRGMFTDVTAASGIPPDRTWPTRAVLAFDADGDGRLDLFCVTNYLGSHDPPGERNEVYRNLGELRFSPIDAGDLATAPCGQGATDADFDGDGHIDVIAANRTGDVNILRNDRRGRFTRVDPASIGIRHRAADGITMADVSNDGHLDMLLASGNVGHLYMNNGGGTFMFVQDFSETSGYMGGFADLNNNGHLDLVFAGDGKVYMNDGTGRFTPGASVPVDGINDPRAIAFADIDGDGDLDFAIGCKRSRNWLVRNDLKGGGHWLKVRLVSPQGQAGAFGARASIYPANQAGREPTRLLGMREARGNNGYLGQDDPVLHFGLGEHEAVDLVVKFVDGSTIVRRNVSAGQTILVAGPPREAPRDGKFAPRTKISIEKGKWHINGRITYPGAKAEGLLLNVRMVNAVFEDRKRPDFDPQSNTDEFLAALADYHQHGARAFTICLQGGMPGYEGAVNSAFEPSGELRGEYLSRVRRVVEACDRQGIAVILGCYYQRQDQVLADETAVRQGVVSVARWIRESGFSNVLLEIANEYPHDGFDHRLLKTAQGQAELIELARREAPGLLVSTSGIGDGKLDREVAEASDFLLIHFNGVPVQEIPDRIAAIRALGGPGKPIVCNEDDKLAAEAARAAEASVANGASWGLMLLKHNQEFPFTFKGAADDAVVYAKLKELSAAQAAGDEQGAGNAAKTTKPPLGSSPVTPHPRLPPSPFPGESWTARQPAEVGLDAERLEELARFVMGSGCVVREGAIVFTWGDAGRRADVASAVKPLYTHFIFLAIDEGRLASVEDRVVVREPKLRELNESLGFKDRRITWRDLACQTSCYGVREPPGEAYDYSDYNMALLADTLFNRVYGAEWENVNREVLAPRLTEPLGCQDNPTLLAFGNDRPGRLAISPRDFARFGLLYLRGGQWNGRQLIRPEHLAAALTSPVPRSLPRTAGEPAAMIPGQRSIGGGNNQTDHFGSYSCAWWINGIDRDGQRHWPAAPLDAYAALGHGGKRALVVIPSLDLVASWNDGQVEGRQRQNRALELLVRTTKDRR